MTALSAPRDTARMGEQSIANVFPVPLAASAKVYEGGIVAFLAGYGVAGQVNASLTCIGRSKRTYDNSTGGNGDVVAEVERGTFRFKSGTAGDTIAQANCGAPCYIMDDQTVGLTDGGGARSLAGLIVAVDSAGVWVEMGFAGKPALNSTSRYTVVAIPVPDLSAIADADVLAKFVPGFAGTIVKTEFQNTKVVTTAAKATTLSPKIGAAPVTGGVLSLTSANQTPKGNVIEGTAVTAANVFNNTDTLSVVASATTAFVEAGSGVLLITLAPT